MIPTAAKGAFPYPHRTVAEVDAEIDPSDLVVIRTMRAKRTASPLVSSIQHAVSAYFDIPDSEMKSARRARDVARPRQIAMYLSRELTPKSLPDIGRRFGDRDHTTVIWAIKQIERLRKVDAELDADVRAIQAELAA